MPPNLLGITPIPCSPSGPAKWGTPGPGAQGALKPVRGCPTCRGASGDPQAPFPSMHPAPVPSGLCAPGKRLGAQAKPPARIHPGPHPLATPQPLGPAHQGSYWARRKQASLEPLPLANGKRRRREVGRGQTARGVAGPARLLPLPTWDQNWVLGLLA